MQVCTETHQRQNKEGGEAVDILLDSNGDLAFKGTDIVLANSVRQKIKIRLSGFFKNGDGMMKLVFRILNIFL